MRRVVTAVVATGALLALSAAPVGAQEIPDVPDLGFEIDPLEGPVGSTVNGLVDTDDVDEHCITDAFDFVGQFVDPENPLGEPSTAYFQALIEFAEPILVDPEADPETDPFIFTIFVAVFFPIGLALDVADPEGGELAEGALASTFIMAFADLETASPIEPFGNFDHNTGEGSVDVPDLEAGVHPVIATCVALADEITVEDIERAVSAGGTFVEANVEPPFPIDILGPGADEFAEVAGQVAPVILEALVEPQALGVQFFCVFDENDECPTDEVPVDDVPVAEAVVVQPVFTG